MVAQPKGGGGGKGPNNNAKKRAKTEETGRGCASSEACVGGRCAYHVTLAGCVGRLEVFIPVPL